MSRPRPTSITVVCIIGFVGAGLSVLAIPAALMTNALDLPGWYVPYLFVSVAVGLATMIGMWRMKKWGVLGYAGFAVLNQVVLGLAGLWSVPALVVPAIVVAIGVSHLPKMD